MVLSRGRALSLLLPAVLLLTSLLAPVARAGPAPDSARLDRMRADAEQWNHFRVTSTLGRHELESLKLDALGVHLPDPQVRPAVIVSGPTPAPQTKIIGWSEIDRIEAGRSHAVSGFFQGALVGGMVGMTGAFIYANHVEGEAALGALGMPILGIVLGGFVGASIGGSPKWQAFYP